MARGAGVETLGSGGHRGHEGTRGAQAASMEPPWGGEPARTLHMHRLRPPGPQALGTTTVLVPTVCHHPAAANWRELITGSKRLTLNKAPATLL